MVHEPCKFEDKIIDMYADVKWLVTDTKRRNGAFVKHIEESDNFRKMVDRNTIWRHVYKIAIGAMCVIIWFVIKLHLTQ